MRDHFDEFDDLKDYMDMKLSNIHITEKLKAKTINQLTPQKRHNHQWVLAPTAAAVALAILFNSPVKMNIANKLIPEQAGVSREKIDYALNNVSNTPAEAKSTTDEKVSPAKPSAAKNIKSGNNSQNQIASSTQKNDQNTKTQAKSNNTTKQQSTPNNSRVAQADTDKNNSSAAPSQGENKAITTSDAGQTDIGGGTPSSSSSSGSVDTPAVNTQSPAVAVIPSLDSIRRALSLKVKSQTEIQIEKASDYLQHPLLLPDYISEGFQMTGIWVPSDSTDSSTEVKTTYMLNDQYFSLYESVKSGVFDSDGNKKIMLNQWPAVVSSTEPTPEDPSLRIKTELQWEDDNLHFRLEGNIPEAQLIEIAKSLK